MRLGLDSRDALPTIYLEMESEPWWFSCIALIRTRLGVLLPIAGAVNCCVMLVLLVYLFSSPNIYSTMALLTWALTHAVICFLSCVKDGKCPPEYEWWRRTRP